MQGRDSRRRRCLGGGGRQKHYKDLDDGGAAVSIVSYFGIVDERSHFFFLSQVSSLFSIGLQLTLHTYSNSNYRLQSAYIHTYILYTSLSTFHQRDRVAAFLAAGQAQDKHRTDTEQNAETNTGLGYSLRPAKCIHAPNL